MVGLRAGQPTKDVPEVVNMLREAGFIEKETPVPKEEAVEFEPPIVKFLEKLPFLNAGTTKEPVRESMQETAIPKDEAIYPGTPIEQLIGRFEDIVEEELFKRREFPVEEGMGVELQTPIDQLFTALGVPIKEETYVDAVDEANYITVVVKKPLGLEFVTNPAAVGGGVQVRQVLETSSISEKVKQGYQLIAVGGMPVYGLQFNEAIRPIVQAQDRFRLTFFKGDVRYFYGWEGPSAPWLAQFMQKLRLQELNWAMREKVDVQGDKTWAWALGLLSEFKASVDSMDTFTRLAVHGGVIRACEKGAQWQSALQVLAGMQQSALEPDVAALGTCVSACDRAGQPVRALRVMQDMLSAGVEPDLRTYSVAVGACRGLLRTLRRDARKAPPAPPPLRLKPKSMKL